MSAQKRLKKESLRKDCTEWLREFLRDQSYFSWYIRSQANKAGFTDNQIDYARRKLKVVSYPFGSCHCDTSWELPE